MRRDELLDQARYDHLAHRAWGTDGRWRGLIDAAAGETRDFEPASAVLWEVLWRLHPELTPTSWKEHGNGARYEHLNPFLADARSPLHVEAVYALERQDPEAAELYAEVVRAERLTEWPDASALMKAASRQRANADEADRVRRQQLEANPHRRPRDKVPEWTAEELLRPKGPSDLLDDYERALTRLVLVGHAQTTRMILPFLMTIEIPSPDVIDEIGMLRFAWDRLDPHDRRTVAGSTIRASLDRENNGGLAKASEVALATALASAMPLIGRFRKRKTSQLSQEGEGEHGSGTAVGR